MKRLVVAAVLLTALAADAFAQIAAVPLQTPGDNAWQQIVNAVIQNGVVPLMAGLSTAIATLLVAAIVRWFKKLGIDLTQAQQAQLQDAAVKSLQWAIMRGLDLIAQKGWDHPDVQQVIMKDAVERMKSAFPDVVAQTAEATGIEKGQVDLVLHPVVLRLVPQVFAQAAASPATPPVDGAPPPAVRGSPEQRGRR